MLFFPGMVLISKNSQYFQNAFYGKYIIIARRILLGKIIKIIF